VGAIRQLADATMEWANLPEAALSSADELLILKIDSRTYSAILTHRQITINLYSGPGLEWAAQELTTVE